jgi:hypothetical protein
MPETIVSPGVLTIENDQSFITQQPIQAGAAIIGPTVKGKVGIPTICTTYSDYVSKFGNTFFSGSQQYSYFTSISAYNYFNNGGNTLLVTRVVSGSTTTDWTPATSSVPSSAALTSASISIDLTFISSSVALVGYQNLIINGITLYYTGSATTPANTSNIIYINTASFSDPIIGVEDYVVSSSAVLAFSSSFYSPELDFISSSVTLPNNLVLTSINPNGIIGNGYTITSGSGLQTLINNTQFFTGGTNTTSFTLETISEGIIMNSDGPIGPNNTLLSGSNDNYRYQILATNNNTGTFTLLIRKGNDSQLAPSILETWSNLSLDPLASNYIEKVIGNQVETITSDNGEYYVVMVGEYPNKSNFLRVKSVNLITPSYFDNNGNVNSNFTSSLPTSFINNPNPNANINGTFGGGKGNNIPTGVAGAYYENITNTNIQGLSADSYIESISLLANKDSYKYNFITIPGLIGDATIYPLHYPVIQQLNTMVQERGDTMAIIDIAKYNENILPVIFNASSFDNSYIATYWPWLKLQNTAIGANIWVPPSTVIPSVYAKNDNIAYPWFAPAGINRGIMPYIITAERPLTQGNRDELYQSNINPIATFPGVGVVVFGQKTLQKKKSALDRVNVRRLLIELKNYIRQIADTFVFEQNTQSTRDELLSLINPYLFNVQQQQGLTSFQVIIDNSNNTPDSIDQNQLIGQIYIQPTKTAEFIILDFNILPTGTTI